MMLMLMQATRAAADAVQIGVATATDNPSATLGLAVVIPFMLQALKNSPWFPWLSRQTSRINFIVGVTAAFASVVGIHATYDISTGGTITLPPLHTFWQAFIQWAGQQVTYKGLVVPAETLGDIRAILHRQEIGQIIEQQRSTLPPVLPPARHRPSEAPADANPGEPT